MSGIAQSPAQDLRTDLLELKAAIAALEDRIVNGLQPNTFDADGSAEYQITEGRTLKQVWVDTDIEHPGVTYKVEDRGPEGQWVVWIGGNPTGVKVTFWEI